MEFINLARIQPSVSTLSTTIVRQCPLLRDDHEAPASSRGYKYETTTAGVAASSVRGSCKSTTRNNRLVPKTTGHSDVNLHDPRDT